MKIKTNFSYALNYFGEADCRIERLIEASPEDFKELQISLQDTPLLLKHKDCMYEQDGVCHCLLVLEQGKQGRMPAGFFRRIWPGSRTRCFCA